MEQMCKHTRLKRRGAVYYFRCKIPADLIEHYGGKREILESLRTADPKEALRKVRTRSEQQEQEFDQVRAGRVGKPITAELIEPLAASWIAYRMGADEQIRFNGVDAEMFELLRVRGEELNAEGRQALAMGERAAVKPAMEEYLTGKGYELPPRNSDTYKALSFAFLKANVRTLKMQGERDRGEVVETPADPVAHAAQPATAGAGMTYLLEYWKAQGDRKAPKTLHEAHVTIARFTELHGPLVMPSVERKHVIAFRDSLAKRDLAPATIKKQLGLLRSMFQVALEDERFGLKANPADAIKVRGEVGERKRRAAFTAEELQRIFAAPVFTKGERPRGGAGEAAYWIPLIALYTGARLNEIGQLRLDDLREEEGIKYFRFTDQGEGQSLKLRGSRRRVPLHPELLRLGLWEYARKLREQNEERLFPLIEPDSRGHLTGRWSKWWGRYLDNVIGIKDASKDFHAFRHTFKHQSRACGIPEDIHDALTGHANDTVARNYGGADGYPLKPLADALGKVRYGTQE
jgi:integrase